MPRGFVGASDFLLVAGGQFFFEWEGILSGIEGLEVEGW